MLSADQEAEVEARVNAMMSSMNILARSSSASAIHHAAHVWGCEETADQRRRKSVAGKLAASNGHLELKRDFKSLGLEDWILPPRQPSAVNRARTPSPDPFAQSDADASTPARAGPPASASAWGSGHMRPGSGHMRADANDVVNYWSTQATSHATISPMAKLTRRPKKQDAEPERSEQSAKAADRAFQELADDCDTCSVWSDPQNFCHMSSDNCEHCGAAPAPCGPVVPRTPAQRVRCPSQACLCTATRLRLYWMPTRFAKAIPRWE